MPRLLWAALWPLVLCVSSSPLDLDRVGTAVNVFSHAGDLASDFRVTPCTRPPEFYAYKQGLFAASPVYVFQDVKSERIANKKFAVDFRLEMFVGRENLLKTYFRDFSIEGVDKPWNAFSYDWSDDEFKQIFGVDSMVSDQFGYVMLKLDLKKTEFRMTNTSGASVVLREALGRIVPRDEQSALNFLGSIGTHYVQSYALGNCLFQIVEFEMTDYEAVKSKILESGSANLTFASLRKFVSPVNAKSVGRIQLGRGDTEVIAWANKVLSRKYGKLKGRAPSLLSILWKPWILDELDRRLSDQFITSLELHAIDRAFPKPSNQKAWLSEHAAYLLKLIEENA